MNSKKAKAFILNNLKILFLSIAIGLFACAISIFAFTSPGSNQPPNGNPIFWLLSGTSMYYSGGNVGIGTSTPGQKLTIEGTNSILELRGGSYLMLRPAANDWDMRLEAIAGNKLGIYSGGDLVNPIATFVNGGNVGIGTASPTTALQVNGTITANAIAGTQLPTRQIFTSGSGTYATPAGVRQIRIRMVGGGGGGGGSSGGGAVAGSNGAATIFNSVYANPGSGGGAGSGGNGNAASGGSGGSGGGGSASSRFPGSGGSAGAGYYGATFSGAGGGTIFGGGAPGLSGASSVSGISAGANTGGGGSGAAANYVGGGGAGGEGVEIIINNPVTSYSYTVGSGGAGG